MFFRFFLILILAFPISCLSDIYKWIDENGKTHFSDKKINGTNQKTVSLNIEKSEWSRFDIDIVTRNVHLTDSENKNITDGVNNVYEFFDKVLFFDIYKTVPVNILILQDKKAYANYLEPTYGVKSTETYGVYLRKKNQIVVYIRKNREHTFKTIKHEVSHAVVHTIMPYTPAWLNEGLAEQMETLKRNDSGLYIESHAINRKSVASAVKFEKLFDISEFLKLPSKKWRHSLVNGKNVLQGQAGQFIYFLLSTRPGRNFVVRLMHKFSRGDRTLSYYLVNENYIGGVKAMELTWRNWVKQQRSQTITFY